MTLVERGFRLGRFEGSCDVGLLVQSGWESVRRRERTRWRRERVRGGDYTVERWRTKERECV
jgi:hypothetical protein